MKNYPVKIMETDSSQMEMLFVCRNNKAPSQNLQLHLPTQGLLYRWIDP